MCIWLWLEIFSIRFFMENGKPFHVVKSKYVTLIAQKTGTIFFCSSSKIQQAHHRRIKKLLRSSKREVVQFLVQKNLAVSHLPRDALPAVQTCTANCKRDRKTVVTWHCQVCGLQFSMKNLILKVSNIYEVTCRETHKCKQISVRACDHHIYLKDLIEKDWHFLLIFLTCCWGGYSVNYFCGHLKTEGRKKYHVSKLPMRQKNQNTVAPFISTQQLF